MEFAGAGRPPGARGGAWVQGLRGNSQEEEPGHGGKASVPTARSLGVGSEAPLPETALATSAGIGAFQTQADRWPTAETGWLPGDGSVRCAPAPRHQTPLGKGS